MAESGFQPALIELQRLYAARSAFVHGGKPISAGNASRLIDYAREVIRSLLVLHLNPENRGDGFHEKWIPKLDFLVAGLKAELNFDSKVLAEQGIFPL
jgi:hypothetical protein